MLFTIHRRTLFRRISYIILDTMPISRYPRLMLSSLFICVTFSFRPVCITLETYNL